MMAGSYVIGLLPELLSLCSVAAVVFGPGCLSTTRRHVVSYLHRSYWLMILDAVACHGLSFWLMIRMLQNVDPENAVASVEFGMYRTSASTCGRQLLWVQNSTMARNRALNTVIHENESLHTWQSGDLWLIYMFMIHSLAHLCLIGIQRISPSIGLAPVQQAAVNLADQIRGCAAKPDPWDSDSVDSQDAGARKARHYGTAAAAGEAIGTATMHLLNFPRSMHIGGGAVDRESSGGSTGQILVLQGQAAQRLAQDLSTHIPSKQPPAVYVLLWATHGIIATILAYILMSKPPRDTTTGIVVPLGQLPRSIASEAPMHARLLVLVPVLLAAYALAGGLPLFDVDERKREQLVASLWPRRAGHRGVAALARAGSVREVLAEQVLRERVSGGGDSDGSEKFPGSGDQMDTGHGQGAERQAHQRYQLVVLRGLKGEAASQLFSRSAKLATGTLAAATGWYIDWGSLIALGFSTVFALLIGMQ